MPVEELTTEVSYGLTEWQLEELGGYEALHRFAVIQRNMFEGLNPIPGAPAGLRRLSNANVRVRIITHRLFINFFHAQAVSQTINWLERYAIPYSDLCFMEEKTSVGAHLYIEDAPRNIERLRAEGNDTIIFSNSTNRDVNGLRADTWDEVVDIVLGRYKSFANKPA